MGPCVKDQVLKCTDEIPLIAVKSKLKINSRMTRNDGLWKLITQQSALPEVESHWGVVSNSTADSFGASA